MKNYNFESENVEFKLEITNDLYIYKEVIAFANSEGGVILIGVDDDGNPLGLCDLDDTYTRLTNGIRDAISPDITMFVKYTIEDSGVISIAVSEGSAKPYYLTGKGLKPSGVYVRQGASSVQASFDQIRSMIKNSDGDVFEEMRSMEQSLTFDSAQKAFSEANIEFSREKFPVLGILDRSMSIYTNLGLLFSDQCVHTIKIAVFSDYDKTIFRDSKEFGGGLFAQLDNAFSYLCLCNNNTATIDGLKRTDHMDYPPEAVREALLNSIVHRDYSFSGSIIINVTDRSMEFISLGGLVPGLSPEDIKSGISQPRNRRLAEVFHRLHLIETYGTGIRRIFSLYADCPAQPGIEVTPNSFKLILPNMNYCSNSNIATPHAAGPKSSTQKQRIMDYVKENGRITQSEIEELLGVKHTRAFNLVRELVDSGLLTPHGRGSGRFYQ